MSVTNIALDADLVAKIDARATSLGRPRDELIAEALQRWLEGGTLRALLDANRLATTSTEDEAMALAIAEQKAARAERAASQGA